MEINPAYHYTNISGTRYEVSDYNNKFFQFFSHSIMALLKIGEFHPELRIKISAAFRNALEDNCYIKNITACNTDSYEFSMAKNLKYVVENKTKHW